MSKPIVFLSHSSRDRKELIAIKELLDKRAVGSIDFFLSCDGQSIPFGRNWVVSISDALADAKLMFVFLSPHSLNSRWVHFEAGTAFAKNVKVVPVCLPGLHFDKVTAPLSLLQGFNLHSAATLGNLARTCNLTLNLKMPEEFSDAEFSQIRSTISGAEGFFKEHTRLIDLVDCHTTTPFNGELLTAVEAFEKIYKTQKADWCRLEKSQNDTAESFGTHGANVRFYSFNEPRSGMDPRQMLQISAEFGTELFALNSPTVEEFGKALGVQEWSIGVRFNKVVKTPDRMKLTTKLFNTGIRLMGKESFDFEGNRFSANGHAGTRIESVRANIRDTWLVTLVSRLFDVGFLLESNDDAETDVDRLVEALRKRSIFDW